MNCKKIVLGILICCFAVVGRGFGEVNDVRIALITDRSAGMEKSPIVPLLEVQLSQKEGIVLLERMEINRLLDEQKLGLSGLLDRRNIIKAGKLLKADAFLLLSAEESLDKDKEKQSGQLIRVRFVDAQRGLRLLDMFDQISPAEAEKTAGRIKDKVVAAIPKITLPVEKTVLVGVVGIHRVQLGEKYQWLERALPVVLSVSLSKEPRLIVLEREDLKTLQDENLLTDGGDSKFWNSSVLMDGYLQRKDSEGLTMKLSLKQSGKKAVEMEVAVEPNEPQLAIEALRGKIVKEILDSPVSVTWDIALEANEFYYKGNLLRKHQRFKEALSSLETAHALQPKKVNFTGELFINEWQARGKKISMYSDLELVELVSLLVRQIDDAYEKKQISVSYILTEYVNPGWGYNHLATYFARPESVSTEQIRMMNRKNRKIWVDIMNIVAAKGYGKVKFLVPPQVHIATQAAWISSDEPQEVIGNLKKIISEYIMPQEMGGKFKEDDFRYQYAEQQLIRTDILGPKIESIKKTHLNNKAEEFRKLWESYLEDLTEVDDPLVQFVAYVAQLNYYNDFEKVRQSWNRAIDVLITKSPDEHCMYNNTKVLMRRHIFQKINWLRYDYRYIFKIYERIFNPLIEKDDAYNLALWQPAYIGRYLAWNDANMVKDAVALLNRIASVLEKAQEKSREINTNVLVSENDRKFLNKNPNDADNNQIIDENLNLIRDTIAQLETDFPQIRITKESQIQVKMLSRTEDWFNLKNKKFEYIRAQFEKNKIWVAFAEPGVGLVCIDLEEKKLVSLWQANCRNLMPVTSRESIHGSIMGIAITEDACFVAIRYVGLVKFPGSLTKGREYYNSPTILTEKDGLPSTAITGLTSVDNKLWIAYGDEGKESGLIIYDPKNKSSETVFCSALKGTTPFNSGNTYEIRSLTAGPDNKLFFFVDFQIINYEVVREIKGLWKLDTVNKDAKVLWNLSSFSDIEVQGNGWWFLRTNSLTKFNPDSEFATFIFGERWPFLQVQVAPEIIQDEFDIQSAKAFRFGPLLSRYINLETAAIYEDKIWACQGMSQIIIIEKGKGPKNAKEINNNILDGEKVLKFFSTSYGLVAIGEGSIGIIETESEQKEK